MAVTVKVYAVPLVSPSTVSGLAGPLAYCPPGCAVTVYPVIAAPPSVTGGRKPMVACAAPATAVTACGGPGTNNRITVWLVVSSFREFVSEAVATVAVSGLDTAPVATAPVMISGVRLEDAATTVAFVHVAVLPELSAPQDQLPELLLSARAGLVKYDGIVTVTVVAAAVPAEPTFATVNNNETVPPIDHPPPVLSATVRSGPEIATTRRVELFDRFTSDEFETDARISATEPEASVGEPVTIMLGKLEPAARESERVHTTFSPAVAIPQVQPT